ncbi:hypothetical protein [Streptomyces sp. NPDC055210]
MSHQHVDPQSTEPLIPRPAVTVEALRAAVERLDPEQTAKFDSELTAFAAEAERTGNPQSMPTFLRTWAVWVERYRVPATATRIHELEIAMGAARTDEEARAVATDMSKLLHEITDGLPLP